MVSARRILSLVLRIVPLVIFLDVIRNALVLLTNLYTTPLTITINTAVTIAGGVVALLTVITGSMLLYSMALVLVTLPSLPAIHIASLPWASIIGLFVMLSLDSISVSFRGGERNTVDVRAMGIVKSIAVFLCFTLIITVPLYLIAQYFTGYINAFGSAIGEVLAKRIGFVETPYILRAILVVVSIAIAIGIVREVGLITTLFLIPSRVVSLNFLGDHTELDTVFKPYFTRTILAVASLAFYPVLWEVLSITILVVPMASLGSLLTQLPFIEVVFNIVAFLITMHILSNIVRLELPFRLTRRRFAYAIAVLLLIYAAAVRLAIDNGATLTSAITAPNFGSLASRIATSYTNYAYYILNFIEFLSRLLGAAP